MALLDDYNTVTFTKAQVDANEKQMANHKRVAENIITMITLLKEKGVTIGTYSKNIFEAPLKSVSVRNATMEDGTLKTEIMLNF